MAESMQLPAPQRKVMAFVQDLDFGNLFMVWSEGEVLEFGCWVRVSRDLNR